MKSNRGSALLVVLGMLSFMVISGLAFSVFMRATRMPSSFTRRTILTRQLAKAALAEAIDQIDRAVANDPHPGVRNPYRKYLGYTPDDPNDTDEDLYDSRYIDNFWRRRVLIGQGGDADSLERDVTVPVVVGTENRFFYPKFAEVDDTVPVLSLEALAYLPPSLVNEVRYYGQRTPTATWQTFDFDSGRYAFIAVDVSDFFDVNRLCAEVARSSDPTARVTMGHIFEKNQLHTSSGSDVDDWAQFMNQYRTVGSDGTLSFSELPFVSLADFNLALGTRVSAGGLHSAFYERFNQKSSSGIGFYMYNATSDDFKKYAGMNFVTDSLEATVPDREKKTANGETIYNLGDDSNQPFSEAILDGALSGRSILGIGQQKTTVFSRLVKERVPYVTMWALCDYLDCDRIPVTLAMPSVERVPMICGIKPNLNKQGKVVVKPTFNRATQGKDKVETKSETVRHKTRTVDWRVDATALGTVFQGGILQTLVAYPFRNHEQQDESSWFKIDGKIQLFLSSEEMRLRTGNRDDCLHWGASGKPANGGTVGLQDNKAVLNLPLEAKAIDLSTVSIANQKVDQLENCVHAVEFTLTDFGSDVEDALKDANGELLTVTYEWDETYDSETKQWDPQFADGELPDTANGAQITAAKSSLYPLKADGTVDEDFKAKANDKAKVAELDTTLYLNLAVTLRVISSNAKVVKDAGGTKTVDMVPATFYDDNDVNGLDNSDDMVFSFYGKVCGDPTPLMKFDTGVTPFNLKLDATASWNAGIVLSPAAVMVDDPRYNHAPENWKTLSDFSEKGWYAVARASAAANDGDIFMATSDQDYMQSVYEFAFLPRLSNLASFGTGNGISGYLPGYPEAAQSWKSLCENTPVDGALMWRTYDIFGHYEKGGDDFEGLGLDYWGRGPKVNPYSNYNRILMAAFANTPHDWRVTSDNDEDNPAGSGDRDDAAQFNETHAWNEFSSGARLSWANLESVAEEFYYRVRNGFFPPPSKSSGSKSPDSDDLANDCYAIENVGDNYRQILKDSYDRFFAQSPVDDGAACSADDLNLFNQNHVSGDASRNLCCVRLDDTKSSSVFEVDKKFLYGYWRSCFAARQQLFLVFFRAEPTMLGGGIAGITPPQLGAKGVAVVWRDPYDPYERKGSSSRIYPEDSNYLPHFTRILFYKEFE